MNTLLMLFAMMGACDRSPIADQQIKPPPPVAPVSTAPPEKGLSKGAVAHYCTEMAAITPGSFANVPPEQVQSVIAARMAESAKSKNLADWGDFEAWLRDTAPNQRQPELDRMIQAHGLETVCRSVSSAAIR